MNSAKGILDKITATSDAIIKENLDKANATAEEIIAKATSESEKEIRTFESGAKATYDEVVRRRVSVSNLDAKKLLMNTRREVVDQVFSKALDKVSTLDKKEYQKLISAMIKSSAKDGDKVVICEEDKRRIPAKLVEDLAKEMDIKLTMAKEVGDFHGGVVLANKDFDKNLTFDVELAELKENADSALMQKLFEE